MSLNKFFDVEVGKKLGFQIGCDVLSATTLESTDLALHELIITKRPPPASDKGDITVDGVTIKGLNGEIPEKGDVYTFDGAGDATLQPANKKYVDSYAEVGYVGVQANREVNDYDFDEKTGSIGAQHFDGKTLMINLTPNLVNFYEIDENNLDWHLVCKVGGFYEVNVSVLIKSQDEETSKLFLTILKNDTDNNTEPDADKIARVSQDVSVNIDDDQWFFLQDTILMGTDDWLSLGWCSKEAGTKPKLAILSYRIKIRQVFGSYV